MRGPIINYYPFHIGDYVSATRHLSWEEDAAYRRLLDIYYTTEKPIPTDLRQVCRLVMAQTESQRQAVQTVLEEFFELSADGWVSRRVERELEAMREKQNKQREKANKRWHKPSAELGIASAMPRHEETDAAAFDEACSGNATNTNTNTNIFSSNEEKKSAISKRPDRVTEEVWLSFLTLRRAKKAPVTSIALRGIEAEATKAGLTLQQALEQCCARGWTGFKADWMREGNQSPRAEAAQSLMRGLTRGIVGGHANVKLIA